MAAESKIRVLAVDDNPVERMLIQRLFKHSSFQVTIVDSGSKALEVLGCKDGEDEICLQKAEVDMVITDFCMPGMTGYDLMKKIKKSSCLRDMPVFIMSSEDVPSRISSCREEGAVEFFLKPVKVSDLQIITDYMNKRKVAEEPPPPPPSQPQPPPPALMSSNKRKVLDIEETLLPETRRARCGGIASVV